MTIHTEEEIVEKVKEIWKPEQYSNFKFKCHIDNDVIKLTLTTMYEHLPLSFKHLKALSEYFGTDNINDDDRFSESGCETCDYGSCYGFTLTIRPE